MMEKLDTTGLRCPLPVLRTEAMLRRMAPGDVLEVRADDPIALIDIPHFCQEAGHKVRRMPDSGAACVFQVTRASKPVAE